MARRIDFEVEEVPGKTTRTHTTDIQIEVTSVKHIWTFGEVFGLFVASIIGILLSITIISSLEYSSGGRARPQRAQYSGGGCYAPMPSAVAPSRSSVAPAPVAPRRDISISSNRIFNECTHTSVKGLPCFHGNRR